MAKRAAKGKGGGLRPVSTNWSEWVVACLGALLVASTIAYLAYAAISHDNRVPLVTVQAKEPVERMPAGFHVPFSARNDSSATAAEVRIEGELLQDGAVVERRSATLDYLPGFSVRGGGLFFRNDPRTGELRLSVAGYQRP